MEAINTTNENLETKIDNGKNAAESAQDEKSGVNVETAQTVASSVHSPPAGEANLQPPTKKQRIETDMSFGFNNEAFADHKLLIKIEGKEEEEPTIVYVSKLILAGKSGYFRENLTAAPTTTIVLQPQYNIVHFIDIIKWMYVDSFDTPGVALLDVMTLAFKFKVKAAIARCANDLTANFMTAGNASKFIENEIRMRREYPSTDDAEFGGFVQLWTHAKQFLRDKFRTFDADAWSSKDFTDMNVEGMKIVLSSNELKIGTENTVFAAFRAWVHTNFEERKYFAAQLLPLIRFPSLQHDYLLDVVRTEADLDYPEDAKKTFAKQIIDAYVYHCCSPDRREALREGDIPKRTFSPELLSTKFYWKLEKISTKKEVWSQPFFLGGYFLYLLMQRKNPTAKGGGTIGLYMHLKIRESGVGQSFYLPLAFELLIRNKHTKKYLSTKGVYASPFTFQNRAWGYVDILGMTWEEFQNPTCHFNENDCLHIKASVAFKDYVPPQRPQ